jgi:hypothetical protein
VNTDAGLKQGSVALRKDYWLNARRVFELVGRNWLLAQEKGSFVTYDDGMADGSYSLFLRRRAAIRDIEQEIDVFFLMAPWAVSTSAHRRMRGL